MTVDQSAVPPSAREAPAGTRPDRAVNEAARALIARMPFLAGAHLLVTAAAGAAALPASFALTIACGAALVMMDGLVWALLGRLDHARLRPRTVLAFAAIYACVSALPLVAMAAGNGAPAVQIAALAGLLISALAFVTAPYAVLVVGLAALAAATLGGLPLPLTAMVAGFGALLGWYSLQQVALLRAAAGRVAEPPPVERARALPTLAPRIDRFVAEFEQSGRGWFWETNPDGRLTYISPSLAAVLGRAVQDVHGAPFVELFSDLDTGDGAEVRTERSIAFQLSLRLAFADVAVRAQTEHDLWWSISGRPLFDPDGVFQGFRGIGSDLSEKKRAEAEMRRLARYDSLTGLANRNAVMRTLEETLRVAPVDVVGCALLLVDLDRFKAVNDSQGHLAGDELLKHVAKRLGEVVGKTGQVGRLGGDEFKIVVPRPEGREPLAELAGKIIAYLSIPYRIGGRTFTIGASVGIAVAEPGELDADALTRRADLALYAAKATGRGSHRFFEPEMQIVAQDRQVLEHDLREALASGGLSLFYQPVVHSATETLAGFEALLRWDHPVQGYVSPAVFVPIAEESGLIVPLGEWVLRTACAEAARMPDHVRMAVNLSPIQFANPSLPSVIVSALANAQLPAHRLELEITEGVFLSQDPKTDDIFAKLKSIGVRLALDDFGTGYSSLGYLKTAPFDKIKIDQSFVRGATVPGSRNLNILRAIVDLAEGLGMDTTAEGAETFDELELIRNLGCSHVQGYIFGRAMPPEEARSLAETSDVVAKSGFHTARHARQRMIRNGVIHTEDGGTLPTLIRNISEGGALVECKRGFAPGTELTLEVTDCGLLAGVVRWSQRDRIGLQFVHEFDVGRLAPVRVKAKAARKMLTPDYLANGEYLKAQSNG